MIYYKDIFCESYELTGLLEQFLNHDDSYEQAQAYFEGKYAPLGEQLIQLRQEIGTRFLQRFSQDAYLFIYLHEEGKASPMELLISNAVDMSMEEIGAQMDSIRHNIHEDPLLFLERVTNTDTDITPTQTYTEDELLQRLDEEMLSDEVKWRLWKVHKQIDQTISRLEEIFIYLHPIYVRYQALYRLAKEFFQQEHAQLYEGKDMYAYICEQCKVSMEEHENDVYVYPSLASCRRISFYLKGNKQAAAADCILDVMYGIGHTLRFLKEQEGITKKVLSNGLKLLSDPSKFAIMQRVRHKSAYGSQLAEALQLSTPTISYHMQALLNAHFICCEKQHNRLYYKMNTAYMRKFIKTVRKELQLEEE